VETAASLGGVADEQCAGQEPEDPEGEVKSDGGDKSESPCQSYH
jgi:hypothetical protein